ncbi:peptide-methionine (R)-S-oxide reductase MsrB [Algicella marina]|uniref:peptide-methionine (R)-S-oxide reductase n=1 Tax=Algicella marina TaxID=2683284 RepID=A0A6P1SVR3_9RHOB|nr:peptide-methionine (R)-S-oxide reductase MsrB [Algicella marina]QHQ33847.1 peptide-methionine (R)-S-oxide reductase MsrB [Algicella marina]
MQRRTFTLSLFATAALPAASLRAGTVATGDFEVTRTEAEWRATLTETQYLVMREGETERAGTSPLDKETRAGTYLCRGCDLPLYSAATKYDSGTGWPSFYQSLPGAVGTMADNTFFSTRTEVHCRRCGSHLGHIFEDGPKPTGKRHCLNGVSLKFRPAA